MDVIGRKRQGRPHGVYRCIRTVFAASQIRANLSLVGIGLGCNIALRFRSHRTSRRRLLRSLRIFLACRSIGSGQRLRTLVGNLFVHPLSHIVLRRRSARFGERHAGDHAYGQGRRKHNPHACVRQCMWLSHFLSFLSHSYPARYVLTVRCVCSSPETPCSHSFARSTAAFQRPTAETSKPYRSTTVFALSKNSSL